jgi:hypothetical protein
VIKAQAEDAQNSMGLSTSAYEQMASVLGSQLKSAGMSGADLTDTVFELQQKGADLAATVGGSTSDAVEALSSVLKGETDPIEKYGVSIKQSDINARLAAQGQDKLTGAALKSATANAALGLVFEQTKDATGAFSREGNTAAGQSERLSAWFENLKAKIGAGLLPAFVALTTWFSANVVPALDQIFRAGGPVSTVFGQIADFVQTRLIPGFTSLYGSLAAKVIPVWQQVGAFITKVGVPAFKAIVNIMTAYVIPIFKTVLGPVIAGVGNIIKTVTAKVLEHKDTFVGLYKSLQPFLAFIRDKVAPFIGGAFKVAFEVAGRTIGVVVDLIAGMIDKIKWVLDKGAAIGNAIGGLFSTGGGGGAARPVGARMVGATAGGGLFAASSSIGGGAVGPGSAADGPSAAGPTYVFNISGVIGDRHQLAATIASMLDERTTRTGGRVAVSFG